jgi:Glycosyl hydrolase family 10
VAGAARYLELVLGGLAVTAVLTWGITDRYTWLNQEDARANKLAEWTLPFDVGYQPKPAFLRCAMRSIGVGRYLIRSVVAYDDTWQCPRRGVFRGLP